MEKVIFNDLKFCLSIMDKTHKIIMDTLEEKKHYRFSIEQLNTLITVMEDVKKSIHNESIIVDDVINYINEGKKTIVRLYL